MPPQVHVFTSAALNYLPKVRILFESLRKHHPEWKLHLVLADTLDVTIDYKQEPLDSIVPIDQLEIPEWRGWAFCHTITELATAIKPFMLKKLLTESEPGDQVLYMDPDTVAFSRLDDLSLALEEAPIILTPHQTFPDGTLAAIIDNEICSLKHGVYNLGFLGVAVNPIGLAFAEWWAQRLYYFCRDDIPNGLFTDQRWIDLVPAFFPGVAIIRSGRHNLATWNITTRCLEKRPDGTYLVDGEPLGFYHFTGFDSGAHRVMAAKNSGKNPFMAELIQWYSDRIGRIDDDHLTKRAWAFGHFNDGSSINSDQRLIYRLRRDLQKEYPDPFIATGYKNWWEQRARKDFPGLFNVEKRQITLRQLQSSLTPGFVLNDPAAALPASVSNLLSQAINDPRTGIELGRKGWQILRQEGIGGLRRRFS
jgi:hypothetical protein